MSWFRNIVVAGLATIALSTAAHAKGDYAPCGNSPTNFDVCFVGKYAPSEWTRVAPTPAPTVALLSPNQVNWQQSYLSSSRKSVHYLFCAGLLSGTHTFMNMGRDSIPDDPKIRSLYSILSKQDTLKTYAQMAIVFADYEVRHGQPAIDKAAVMKAGGTRVGQNIDGMILRNDRDSADAFLSEASDCLLSATNDLGRVAYFIDQ